MSDIMVSPESIDPWLHQVRAAEAICDFMGWPDDGPAWDDANKLAARILALSASTASPATAQPHRLADPINTEGKAP